jgi:Arc/MetJ-type ribon-helix-helix transcriptional regulator
MSKNEASITVRVPRNLKDLVRQFVAKDTHINESDFVRDAVREKILREAPELFKRLFKEAPEHGS